MEQYTNGCGFLLKATRRGIYADIRKAKIRLQRIQTYIDIHVYLRMIEVMRSPIICDHTILCEAIYTRHFLYNVHQNFQKNFQKYCQIIYVKKTCPK